MWIEYCHKSIGWRQLKTTDTRNVSSTKKGNITKQNLKNQTTVNEKKENKKKHIGNWLECNYFEWKRYD
jgi:hypothetical protein